VAGRSCRLDVSDMKYVDTIDSDSDIIPESDADDTSGGGGGGGDG
jgi:hypothetical protein